MANNEAKIKFTAETGEFNKSIKQANDEMSLLRAELKLNETQMKTTGASVELLEKQHDLLEDQLKASESKTEALSQKVEKAAAIFGENSTEVTKLKTQLANAQTAEEKIKQALEKCNTELKENKDGFNEAADGAEELDKSLDKAGEETEKFEGKISGLGVGLAAAGAALVKFGNDAIDAFNEVDDGADNVIKATGATGEAAAELETAYKNVASSIVGDFGDIGTTLGEVNTRFGFTGSEAEETTKKFLKFAEVTGMDAATAVQDVSRAIESAGLDTSEYGAILDSLTTAGQVTGVSVETLASSLTDNGAVMRGMGYDTNTTIAMLAQFEKAGVNSNAVVKGMQKAMVEWSKDGLNAKDEFAKLVTGIKDGSVSAGEAYEIFGTKAGPELVDAIQSGRFEYEDMVAVIEGSKGSLDGTFDATVDGGYELELAMQNAKMALAEAGGEIGTALTPVLKGFSKNVLPAATKAIGAMVKGITNAVKWMKEHKGIVVAVASVIGVLATAITAYNVVQGIKTAMDAAQVTTIWGLVAAHWAQATAAMAAMAPYILIVAAIAAVIAIIVLCVQYWDQITAAVVGAAQACWEAIKVAWDWIVNLFTGIVEWINVNVIQPVTNFFTGLWNGIVSGCQAAWDWICGIFTTFVTWVDTNIVQPVIGFFTGLWTGIVTAFHTVIDPWIEIIKRAAAICNETIIQPIKNFFVDLWNSIVSGLQTAWDSICSVFSTVANWVDANVIKPVANFFTGLWNGVVNGVTSAIDGVKNVFSTVSNWVNSNVIKPITGFFSNLWSGFTSGARKAWDGVKSVFSKVGQFFGNIFNTVKDKILAVFSAGGKLFVGIKDGIVSTFKTVVNAIIKGINKVICLPFQGLNKILNTIHGLDILGVHPFGWLTWRAPIPEIPLLAQGAYVKANSPMLAVIGDNKREGEFVAPESKLTDAVEGAVERAMAAFNISALAAAIEDLASRPIALDINGREFALATAGDSDRVNGMRNRIIERGVLLD
jgi:phage-related minor tail protein